MKTILLGRKIVWYGQIRDESIIHNKNYYIVRFGATFNSDKTATI